MPPGPEPLDSRRSLAAMASTWVGSSPISRRASVSTATLSAGVSARAEEGEADTDEPLVGAELQRDELARVLGGGQAHHERIVGGRAAARGW